jgi:hypothetical protein
MIEGIFVRTEEGLPMVFEPKTARHHLVQPGQRLDIWIGGEQYISGYYASGFDENKELTDHMWYAHPGGGYLYLAGAAPRHNGEMEVRLYEQVYPNPLGVSASDLKRARDIIKQRIKQILGEER